MKAIETHELGMVYENGVLARIGHPAQEGDQREPAPDRAGRGHVLYGRGHREGEEVERQHQGRHALRTSCGRLRVQRFIWSIAIAFVLAAALPVCAAPADPLWLKAVESASRVKEWSPGEMRLAIEMADDKGKVLETWDYQYRISMGEGGVLRTEVVSASHNGKDETQKEREAQARREAKAERDGGAQPEGGSNWTGFMDDPFNPAEQDSVEIRQLAATSNFAGTTCVAFAFTQAKPKNMAVEGTAWLDAATGLPVRFVSSTKPLPSPVRELVTTVRYADRVVSEIRVESSISVLFSKRRIVTVVTLGEWRRLYEGD